MRPTLSGVPLFNTNLIQAMELSYRQNCPQDLANIRQKKRALEQTSSASGCASQTQDVPYFRMTPDLDKQTVLADLKQMTVAQYDHISRLIASYTNQYPEVNQTEVPTLKALEQIIITADPPDRPWLEKYAVIWMAVQDNPGLLANFFLMHPEDAQKLDQ